MDFEKLKGSASTFFQRAIQKVEESVNVSDKTPIPDDLDNLALECNKRRAWTQSLIDGIECIVQPNPALRAEEMVLREISRKKERSRVAEVVGDSMKQISGSVGEKSPLKMCLHKCGTAQSDIGAAEKLFYETVTTECIGKLRNYLTNESKVAKQRRDELENIRLDYDRIRGVHRRAKQPVSQDIEDQLAAAKTKFDDACTAARTALDEAMEAFDQLTPVFDRLLEEQVNYFESCLRTAKAAFDG